MIINSKYILSPALLVSSLALVLASGCDLESDPQARSAYAQIEVCEYDDSESCDDELSEDSCSGDDPDEGNGSAGPEGGDDSGKCPKGKGKGKGKGGKKLDDATKAALKACHDEAKSTFKSCMDAGGDRKDCRQDARQVFRACKDKVLPDDKDGKGKGKDGKGKKLDDATKAALKACREQGKAKFDACTAAGGDKRECRKEAMKVFRACAKDVLPEKDCPGKGKSDRPKKGDRPKGDRPKGDRPKGDRPKGERPKGDRPKGCPNGNERPDAACELDTCQAQDERICLSVEMDSYGICEDDA